MLSTGHPCDQAGAYRSTCCKQDIAGKLGTILPICPRCMQETQWVIVFLAMSTLDGAAHAAAPGIVENP